MKKIISSIIATLGVSGIIFGQATLEQSYQTTSWTYEQTNAFKTDAGLHYFTLNKTTKTLLIYNSSHSLIKTVIIPVATGFNLDAIWGVTDKLFNADSLVEFVVFSRTDYNSTNGTVNNMTLVNENGTILQQFGNRFDAYIIKGLTANFKLITLSDPFSPIPQATNYTYDVYSLPGTSLGNIVLNKNSNSLTSYPNPTENKISITNNLATGQNEILEIFDLNGKKVMQKNITGNTDEIIIDTTELSNGVYIYKLNGQTNKFIKK